VEKEEKDDDREEEEDELQSLEFAKCANQESIDKAVIAIENAEQEESVIKEWNVADYDKKFN
jgi:hypothetical protein